MRSLSASLTISLLAIGLFSSQSVLAADNSEEIIYLLCLPTNNPLEENGFISTSVDTTAPLIYEISPPNQAGNIGKAWVSRYIRGEGKKYYQYSRQWSGWVYPLTPSHYQLGYMIPTGVGHTSTIIDRTSLVLKISFDLELIGSFSLDYQCQKLSGDEFKSKSKELKKQKRSALPMLEQYFNNWMDKGEKQI